MQHAFLSRLPAFLVEAKRHTYAGLDDDATVAAPLLPGSRQLEHAGIFTIAISTLAWRRLPAWRPLPQASG